MVSEIQNSDLVDPLNGLSGPSLFPRTIRASSNGPFPTDHNDLQSIHDFMKSVVLRSPNKLFEKAKAVVSGSTEALNSDFASFAAVKDSEETVAAEGKENRPERRPGLGRKRARFSFKPSKSQPDLNLDSSLDIDKLADPEEFFLALERLENAKQEILRQTGVSATDVNEFNTTINERTRRPRRPGILGSRKSVSYKHRYSSVLSGNDDTFTSSQEALGQEVFNPPNPPLHEQTTDIDVEKQERELAESVDKTENRVNELLHELLSSNPEDLEGPGALSLLQERLHIKPLDLGELRLPDFRPTGKADLAVFRERLPRHHNSLLDLHGKTTTKRREIGESSILPQASPTPPRSPFASLSLLKKRISQSNPSRDPFSPLNLDILATRNPSVEHIDDQGDQVKLLEKSNISGKLKSLLRDEITKTTVANMGSQKLMKGGPVHLSDEFLRENSSRQRVDTDFRSIGSDLEDRYKSNNMDERSMDYSENRPNADTDVRTNVSCEMEENVEDMSQQAVSTVQPPIVVEDSTKSNSDKDTQIFGSLEMEDNVEDILEKAASSAQQDGNVADPALDNLSRIQCRSDKSRPAAVEDHAMDVPSTTSEGGQEQHIEKRPSKSLSQQSKAQRLHEQRQRKALSRRQSLADAGTSFKGGVRRSNRIKMRPLEYWKGERFLYGRIHNSLTTVIGVKYISPTKGAGKSTMKVKSYVSDQYKELVDLVALH